jgi:phospholipid/cholesterol/gamma-HCH transport system ATP-binding protein
MAPIIECRDVACGYDRPVLEHVDLAVERGEIVALLGGSGCGKSTLLRSLIGLLPPIAGDVRLFDRSLYSLPRDERDGVLRRIGVVFQNDALFGSLSVLDNVALPLREASRLPEPVIREMARMRLSLVGLDGLGDRMPSAISGGQRKRTALARASILDPEIIFCDEPSSSLDPVIAAQIDETLLELRRLFGTTIVLITHELESIRAIADRAVMLVGGTVRATGTIAELSVARDPDVHNFFHRVAPPRYAS